MALQQGGSLQPTTMAAARNCQLQRACIAASKNHLVYTHAQHVLAVKSTCCVQGQRLCSYEEQVTHSFTAHSGGLPPILSGQTPATGAADEPLAPASEIVESLAAGSENGSRSSSRSLRVGPKSPFSAAWMASSATCSR